MVGEEVGTSLNCRLGLPLGTIEGKEDCTALGKELVDGNTDGVTLGADDGQ